MKVCPFNQAVINHKPRRRFDGFRYRCETGVELVGWVEAIAETHHTHTKQSNHVEKVCPFNQTVNSHKPCRRFDGFRYRSTHPTTHPSYGLIIFYLWPFQWCAMRTKLLGITEANSPSPTLKIPPCQTSCCLKKL